jgi:hypothetical protein
VPSKKSTFVKVPSLSVAVAVMVIFAGAETTALFDGEVMLTVGAASTFTVRAAEVVAVPWLSVARAVRTWLPPAAFTIVKL